MPKCNLITGIEWLLNEKVLKEKGIKDGKKKERREVRREKGRNARLEGSSRGSRRQEKESLLGWGWERSGGLEGTLEKDY